MTFTELSRVYSVLTCGYFIAGAVAPETVLTETTVAMLICLWGLFPLMILLGAVGRWAKKGKDDNGA